jgi:hypothetical protein
MFPVPANRRFYACWRIQLRGANRCRETNQAAAPPERLLQAVWHHQRLRRGDLRTADGRVLRVLHPGFWNWESGPDFRNAVLQLGDEAPRSGDVEVDVRAGDWRGHAHHRNDAFANVLLHVVWQEGGSDHGLPTLFLKDFLDAPIEELGLWLDTEAARSWPEVLSGNCCAPLAGLSQGELEELLRQAALVRLERKANDLFARSRQAGWEQALWEGLFRGLGYKHNVWPMQRLAELLPQPDNCPPGVLEWQARLFGLSGLLPANISRFEGGVDRYLRRIWDVWWRDRATLEEMALPRTVWRLNGLRPANHPQRRLALAGHWLASGQLIHRLENWFADKGVEKQPASTLVRALQSGRDPFWSRRWTLRSAAFAREQPLIGESRATDLAVNVILPWFWMRAVAGRNGELQARAEERYFAWPAAQDNAVLRLARRRLLQQTPVKRLRTAAAQQGLLQIVRDFCANSNAVCANCRFPELVREWQERERV